MRDLLKDLDAGRHVSDPDPVRRAQNLMRAELPRRFYEKAGVELRDGGHAVLLDGRLARTPGRAGLILPTEAAARLVADEFAAQEQRVDPVTMPVTRIVNTAIDGVAPNPGAVLDDIVRFSASDLVCYRADGPDGLVARENAAWNPVLDWAARSMGARFLLAEGVMHVEQPAEAVAAVGRYLAADAGPLRLACLHVLTSLCGSALLAVAVDAGALAPQEGWSAAHVDEDWNAEQWGEDADAVRRRAVRETEYRAAVALLGAL